MKVYGSNAIRNVAFVGHGASGKTSLVDALAWVAGPSRRHGNIKDGTTLTDYSPDEIDRKHSIRTRSIWPSASPSGSTPRSISSIPRATSTTSARS